MKNEHEHERLERDRQSARIRKRLKPFVDAGLFRVSSYCPDCGGGGIGCEKCRNNENETEEN